ncbi:MAG: helix-turn-helix transcriptional regulator [Ruminococcaceae bacterium]|nr:helix-turn-helix transcriptional regulator [Oscillospiraceae bacterium]
MLNETIKALRQSFHLSQVELAKALGVSKQCVSNWENDNIQPSIDMLVRLAGFFHVTCDYLLGLERTQLVDVSGLSDTEIAHIKLLISDLKTKG